MTRFNGTRCSLGAALFAALGPLSPIHEAYAAEPAVIAPALEAALEARVNAVLARAQQNRAANTASPELPAVKPPFAVHYDAAVGRVTAVVYAKKLPAARGETQIARAPAEAQHAQAIPGTLTRSLALR